MNSESNTFSLSTISSSTTSLECVLQVSTTRQEEYVKKRMRAEMFHETEGYAVTHFYCPNHHYDSSNKTKIIKENEHQLIYHLTKLYYHQIDEEHENDKSTQKTVDESESSIFFAVGSFQSVIPFSILCKDLVLLERHENGEITPCSSLKCWSPNQLVCQYLGDEKELDLILFIQKGSSLKIPSSLPNELELFLPSFFSFHQSFSTLENDFSTDEGFVPNQDCIDDYLSTDVTSSALNKKKLVPIHSTSTNDTSSFFCPFRTISIVPLNSSLLSLDGPTVRSFYCRIQSKFPMNIYQTFSRIVNKKMKQLEYSADN